PERPDAVLDCLGAGVVRRGLERPEQEIEVVGLLGGMKRRQAFRRHIHAATAALTLGKGRRADESRGPGGKQKACKAAIHATQLNWPQPACKTDLVTAV